VIASTLKEQITQCVDDMEETRKEMFRVAKLMLKLKENLTAKNATSNLN